MQVLEGLEPVRKRPGMYIGSTGPTGLHHLVWEVVDNSVDEAMAGYCDPHRRHPAGRRRLPGRRQRPRHPGRRQPEYKMSGVEIALTKLARRRQVRRRRLQGLRRPARRRRVGRQRAVEQARRRGRPRRQAPPHGVRRRRRAEARKLKVVGDAPRGRTGTTVTFWPDPIVFETTEFAARDDPRAAPDDGVPQQGPRDPLQRRARRATSSRAGHVQVRRRHRRLRQARQRDEGAAVLQGRLLRAVPRRARRSRSRSSGTPATTTDGLHSFANGIATIEGGMHEEGFRDGAHQRREPVRQGRRTSSRRRTTTSLGEDIREGLTAIISVRLRDPQFEGQTKAKLGNTEIQIARRSGPPTRSSATGSRSTPPRPTRSSRRRIAASQARIGRQAGARRHPPQVAARRRRHARQAHGLLVRNRDERELFIVEGDSAGGSAIKARDPRRQAILPIRGKILNVERARIDKMLKNDEIQALISAIGAGIGEEFDVEKLRYDKIIADVRRRRRRLPHPHAAAHVLLPPDEARSSSTATCTSRSRRCTRPRSARRRCT